MPAERPELELGWAGRGRLVTLLDRCEDEFDETIGEAKGKLALVGAAGEVADVNVETITAFRSNTPSQTKAKELEATSARHSPSKAISHRGLNVFVLNLAVGLEFLSLGSAVQLFLSQYLKAATVPLLQVVFCLMR